MKTLAEQALRLDEIRQELFDTANTLALLEQGDSAVSLHQCASLIRHVSHDLLREHYNEKERNCQS